MSKVVVRRNFGCGTKMTAFSHKKNLARRAPPIAPEPTSITKPHKATLLFIKEQANRLSYLYFLIHKYEPAISLWEREFLDSMETRLEQRREMTDKQAAVVERIITKCRQGSNPYNEYLKEKRNKGPLYVSFLPEIDHKNTDLC